MKIIFDSKKEEAVKSLSVVSRNLTRIRDEHPNLTPEDLMLFRYLQLELINAANIIGGSEAAEIIFDSMDSRKKQIL